MKKKEESFFKLITQKPWDPSQAKLDDLHNGETLNLSKGKLGLRFIMIVSSIFFCLFIYGYYSITRLLNFNLLRIEYGLKV